MKQNACILYRDNVNHNRETNHFLNENENDDYHYYYCSKNNNFAMTMTMHLFNR